jgi:transposase
MPLKNRYQKYSKISERKFRSVLRYFALDFTATDTARLASISVRSVNTIFLNLRKRIAQECEKQTLFKGVVEIDGSYFGPRHIRGKRGRGVGGKTIVFGIFKRDDKVYTEIVPDASKAYLIKVIRGYVAVESVIHPDGWRGYNGLVDVGYSKHLRVHHGHNEFATGSRHINGIESFWNYSKRRLIKFNGVAKHTFSLHLKKTEFRFNHRSKDLYKILLKMLREQPLS